MPELLIIHIGPVQEFIAAARRSRDLWFGSWLLSELSKAAAHSIAESEGSDALIFPSIDDLSQLEADSKLTAANKIVAEIDSDVKSVTKKARKAVICRLNEISNAVLDPVKGKINYELAQRQIEDLLEFFWVSLPLDGPYPQRRAEAEALMGARKATRQFSQLSGDPMARGVPKSSLDGQRESVIAESWYASPSDPQDVKDHRAQILYNNFGARPAERLSAVDLVKRLGNPSGVESFPSTSHVAALPFVYRLEQQSALENQSAIRRYVVGLKKLGLNPESVRGNTYAREILDFNDASMFFTSRLSEQTDNKETLEDAKQLWRQLQRELTPSGLEPQPYYALLLGDGDFMGQVIDAQETQDQHQDFSRTLSEFATMAKEIVESYTGALVYAGGDDVMAFLPLHTALQCAQQIAATFHEHMSGFKNVDGNSPTFSAGLVVAHHLSPLSGILQLAHEAERLAKAQDGKNSLAITISKRSGADRTIVGRWKPLVPRLEQLVRLRYHDVVPAGAAYDLRQSASTLANTGDPESDELLAVARRKEAERILKRKEGQRGQKALDEATVEELVSWLDQGLDVNQLADLLIVAQDFAAARLLADGPPQSEPAALEGAVQ